MPAEEKLHLALYARFMPNWTTKQKLALLNFYETARTGTGGHSFAGYIENSARDLFAGLNEDERAMVLADGTKWPNSALSVLAKLPDNPGRETLVQLVTLDKQIAGVDEESARKLGIGIVAVLGHSGDADAMAYLRELYEKQPDRRGYIAMALSEHPEGENWQVLVRSLPIVDGSFAQQVLSKLATVDQAPDTPEPYRQVIIRGLKLQHGGGRLAIALLEKWSGKKLTEPGTKLDAALAAWQKWFAETYPDVPEAKLPEESAANRWTFDELQSFLSSNEAAKGSGSRGAAVFVKAQCAKCHRFGDRGEGVGPDLTTVSQRFQKKEILESILFPSQVISDQYASKSVQRIDGRVVWGIVAPQADGSVSVLQSDGTKVLVSKDDIDSISPIKKSVMPEGLFNPLSLEEIADLFAYLSRPLSVPGAPEAKNDGGTVRR
jgi:putative heme-binding domain-containing protein